MLRIGDILAQREWEGVDEALQARGVTYQAHGSGGIAPVNGGYDVAGGTCVDFRI